MANPESFYVRGDDGLEYGPVALEEMREWVRENRAGLGTNVRYDETGSAWQPWQAFPELVSLLAQVRAGVAGTIADPAPMARRGLALVLDLILCYLLLTPILTVLAVLTVPNWKEALSLTHLLSTQTQPPEVIQYIVVGNLIRYTVLVVYMAGFHAAHGRTPAKSMLRLRVIDETGGKPSLLRTMLRALVFVISLDFFYCLPLAYAWLNPQRRALHDWLAGTYVVETK